MRTGLAVAIGAGLVLGALGCDGGTPPAPTPGPSAAPAVPDLSALPPAPTPEAWTDADTAKVEFACGICHPTPPPAALPRAEWRDSILSMATMPAPEDLKPLPDSDLVLALAYYERRAPVVLAPVEQAPGLSTRVRFRVEQLTPRGLEAERIPAVANVAFLPLTDAARLDVVVCEMRTSTLMIASPWGPTRSRGLRPMAQRMNYPVHASLSDVDGDGAADLLVAGHGGMNRSNDTRGTVALLLREGEQGFRPHVIARRLGRTVDARAADLDGDGDADVAVTSFGFRGPGDLRVLENVSATPREPQFRSHLVDDRDGYIHVEPVDLDGDGRLDLVTVLSQEYEQVLAYLNRGGWQFEEQVLFAAPHPGWGYSGLELVDFDGDGDDDLLLSNGDTLDDYVLKPYHGVRWLENLGGLEFRDHVVGSFYGCERAVSGDVDGDGDLDVVAVSFLPHIDIEIWKTRNLDSVVWFERDEGRWILHSLEKQANIHPTVAVADYDRDGKLDIVVGNWIWLEPDSTPRMRADYVTLFTQL